MRKGASVEQLRAAGRKRAEDFTSESQSELGRRRAQQASFLEHNQAIASDGFSAWSAYMRGPAGLPLLQPGHIQFLQPQQLRGPCGVQLSYERQRILFGLYVWRAVWDGVAPRPNLPTDESFLIEMDRVQARLQCGFALENPLDVVYAAPDDFCDGTGEPWPFRKQRKLFREAIAAGELAAREHAARAIAEYVTAEWRLGQRRPQQRPPIFGHHAAGTAKFIYGRPDLPTWHPYNIKPQRPYGIPMTNDRHPVYWLQCDSQDDPD